MLVTFLAGAAVTWITPILTAKREHRSRSDALRLETYDKTIDLVVENEKALAGRHPDGQAVPIELQITRLRMLHRLRLVGSPTAVLFYEAYAKLVFSSTALPIDRWPPREEVDRARDDLLKAMELECNPG